MLHSHVPFKRQFATPSRDHSDNDFLAYYGAEKDGATDWDGISKHQCVVILGEGKCGKTHEFKQQHAQLRQDGKYAFFIPLEMLQDSELREAITESEENELNTWLTEGEAEAVFFLDAVDELKLRGGTIRKAVRHLKQEIGSGVNRSRFVISCRPNDWENELDIETIATLLPPIERKVRETIATNGERLFLSAVTREESNKEQDGQAGSDERVKVLALQPLSRSEILEFAKCYDPEQVSAFSGHLNAKELWHIYQFPADIISAVDQLSIEGRLGNLQEQLEFGINQKISEVSDKKRNELSEKKAREGSERLALALYLMKRRSIYLDQAGKDPDGVNISDVLDDWTGDERRELVSKSLFDPVAVGAVQFHHRSTQEFLAAHRLNKLRELGLPTRELFSLLFADIREEKVIVPSMEPLVAWLALWHRDVLAEVKVRNPLLLFRQGIPSILNLELKQELLRIFVKRFAESDWRRIGVSHSELKRVADPKLSPVVKELWQQAYSGHDTRELLLELVFLAPMPECKDLVFAAAFDVELPPLHRTFAAEAVFECGSTEQQRAIATSVMTLEWPERVVRNLLPSLLSNALELDEFIGLSRSLKEQPKSVHGLGYALYQAIKSSQLTQGQLLVIREAFTDDIWGNRSSDSRIYHASSQFSHFVDVLFALCLATVPSMSQSGKEGWGWSLAVAFHFDQSGGSIIARKDVEKLKKLLEAQAHLREVYFWACFDLAEELEQPKSDWDSFYLTTQSRVLNPFSEFDFPWLLEVLPTTNAERRRAVAFQVLADFCYNGENPELAFKINQLIADRPDMLERLQFVVSPPARKPEQWELDNQREQKEREEKEAQRIEEWKQWRDEVLSDDELGLGHGSAAETMSNLHRVVQMQKEENDSWGSWNSAFVVDAFSQRFLDKIRVEMSKYWRNTAVKLFSERPKDARNSFPESSLRALSAVKCCSEMAGWALRLTHQEAVLAVRISCIEINGFASFLTLIEQHHPLAVEEVLTSEVKAQIRILANGDEAPILHDILYHGSPLAQEYAVNAIIKCLPLLNSPVINVNRHCYRYACQLVEARGSQEQIKCVAEAIHSRLLNLGSNDVGDRGFWLYNLALLNIECACELLLLHTEDLSTDQEYEAAIALFAALFGEHRHPNRPTFEGLGILRRLMLLERLLIRAYQVIKPNDDITHEGVHSPGTRDKAQQARNNLLDWLTSTKSASALPIIQSISKRIEFAHFSDRLRQMATELAAQISEPKALSAHQFRCLDQDQTYAVVDERSLFNVMKNRLDDFEHHLINDEFSTIDTFRKVETETEVRRFISSWLLERSRDAYNVTQEAVVASEKRTDIRLHAASIDSYATIELKLDDSRKKWSGRELSEALQDQLVGRYLNHERCRVGCLLIAVREPRMWQNPETRKRMNLKTTVKWLNSIAEQIMQQRPELLLVVKGLDYSKAANSQ